MTEIPDDVMQAARAIAKVAVNERHCQEMSALVYDEAVRTLLAEREKSRKRVEELEAGLREIERLYWREGADASWRAAHMNGIARKVLNGAALLRKEGTDA